ncbi:MAG: cytochrome c-type biogenesis protein [Steroidobacteraceae bacterium]
MKSLLLCLVAMLAFAGIANAIDPAPPFEDPVQQTRYLALIHELRCLKCQGENIADTPALFAVDMRRQVREMISAGRSDHEIRDFMVDRYGEIILLKPRWSLKNAWLWLSPGVLLVVGVIVGVRIIRGRRELLANDIDDDVEPRDA